MFGDCLVHYCQITSMKKHHLILNFARPRFTKDTLSKHHKKRNKVSLVNGFECHSKKGKGLVVFPTSKTHPKMVTIRYSSKVH